MHGMGSWRVCGRGGPMLQVYSVLQKVVLTPCLRDLLLESPDLF